MGLKWKVSWSCIDELVTSCEICSCLLQIHNVIYVKFCRVIKINVDNKICWSYHILAENSSVSRVLGILLISSSSATSSLDSHFATLGNLSPGEYSSFGFWVWPAAISPVTLASAISYHASKDEKMWQRYFAKMKIIFTSLFIEELLLMEWTVRGVFPLLRWASFFFMLTSRFLM
jgi:hypothetical protein